MKFPIKLHNFSSLLNYWDTDSTKLNNFIQPSQLCVFLGEIQIVGFLLLNQFEFWKIQLVVELLCNLSNLFKNQ